MTSYWVQALLLAILLAALARATRYGYDLMRRRYGRRP